MRYLGIDWSRKTSHFDIGDRSGKRLKRGTINNDDESFKQLVREWKDEEGIFVVIEVGPRTFQWARAMKGEGATVYVVETHGNALIRESTRKTDKRDATQLREQGRLGMLPPDPVPVPSPSEEELRLLVAARAKAIAERTRISNQATRIADGYSFYQGKGACTKLSGWQAIFSKSEKWSRVHQVLLKQLYQRFLVISEQIGELEKELEKQCTEGEFKQQIELLKTIPGVGPVNAWALMARIGDVSRFKNARKVVRYAGLAPSQRQSGNIRGNGHLAKSGNSLWRSYMVQAALAVVSSKRPNNPLRIWYEQVKKRRGWKKARLALARKILTIAYGVLKSGQPFDEERLQAEVKAAA